MARPLRVEFAGALYHITSRGDRREAIYEDDEDREAFLRILAEVVERDHWVCHAFCLMTNHYHLLVETREGNLSQGMRHLNGVYTQASNRRHRRVGHLFQGRFNIWQGLRQQIYLGDEAFVKRMQAKAEVAGDTLSVPQAQRRPPPAPLSEIAARRGGRNAAIVAAYATGGYSYREIAEYFGVLLATVGRIVRGAMQQSEN